MPVKRVRENKRYKVFDFYEGICVYCGTKVEKVKGGFTVDHVIPMSRGGASRYDNLVLSCNKCNKEKASFDIEEYREYLWFRKFQSVMGSAMPGARLNFSCFRGLLKMARDEIERLVPNDVEFYYERKGIELGVRMPRTNGDGKARSALSSRFCLTRRRVLAERKNHPEKDKSEQSVDLSSVPQT